MITRGMGTVANGMQAMLDFEDVTAHNLANVTTNGFKRSNIIFQDILQSKVQTKNVKNNYNDVGTLSVGPRSYRTYIDFSQGGLMESGNKMDVAIQGQGFFKIRYQNVKDTDPIDIRNYYYQRVGNFAIDDENYLVNKEGDYVMDIKNKRIRITRDPDTVEINQMNRMDLERDLVIGETGRIELNNPGFNVQLQKIQVVDFKDKTKVSNIGNAKYLPIYGQNPEMYMKKDGEFSLQQGMVEMSNSNTVVEMINTINVSRGYEAMSNILRTQSETVAQAIGIGNLTS